MDHPAAAHGRGGLREGKRGSGVHSKTGDNPGAHGFILKRKKTRRSGKIQEPSPAQRQQQNEGWERVKTLGWQGRKGCRAGLHLPPSAEVGAGNQGPKLGAGSRDQRAGSRSSGQKQLLQGQDPLASTVPAPQILKVLVQEAYEALETDHNHGMDPTALSSTVAQR